jgi:hypothetical protein
MLVRRFLIFLTVYALAVILAIGLLLPYAAVSQAVVVPPETENRYIFPPGKYILGGGAQPARGTDTFEIKKPFSLRSGQYILSGGPLPMDRIVVDDDLEVSSGEKLLFLDDDHVASTEMRQGWPCTYEGTPIILVLNPKAQLRIQAVDHCANDAILGELYLHRHDGARQQLTKRIAQNSDANLPHVFFSQEFALDRDFAGPAAITDVLQMPECPASLLSRENNAPAPARKHKKQ